MAGHARYTALLDACVLFPIGTCNALMSVAGTGIFAAKWTAAIDDEWMRNLAAAKGIAVEKLAKRRDEMHNACPDWEVPPEAWERLVPSLRLPDANDRHVLAAAIAGHADCIVTTNLKDFRLTPSHRWASKSCIPTTSWWRRSRWRRSTCFRLSRPCVRDT